MQYGRQVVLNNFQGMFTTLGPIFGNTRTELYYFIIFPVDPAAKLKMMKILHGNRKLHLTIGYKVVLIKRKLT